MLSLLQGLRWQAEPTLQSNCAGQSLGFWQNLGTQWLVLAQVSPSPQPVCEQPGVQAFPLGVQMQGPAAQMSPGPQLPSLVQSSPTRQAPQPLDEPGGSH